MRRSRRQPELASYLGIPGMAFAVSLLTSGCFLPIFPPTYSQETVASSFSVLVTRLDPLTGAASPTESIGVVTPESAGEYIGFNFADLVNSEQGSLGLLSFNAIVPDAASGAGIYEYGTKVHGAVVLSLADSDRMIDAPPAILPSSAGGMARLIGGGLLVALCRDGSAFEIGPGGSLVQAAVGSHVIHDGYSLAFPSAGEWGLVEVMYEGFPGFLHVHGPGASVSLDGYPNALGMPTYEGGGSFLASFRIETVDSVTGSRSGAISVRRIDGTTATVTELGRFPEPPPPPSEPDFRSYTLSETLPDGVVLSLVSGYTGHIVRLGLDGAEICRVPGSAFEGIEWPGPTAGSGIAFAFPVVPSELSWDITQDSYATSVEMVNESDLSLRWQKYLEPSAARLVGLLRLPTAVVALQLLPEGVRTVTIKHPPYFTFSFAARGR